MIKIIEGNILTSPDTFIAHQCNCTGKFVGGVAAAIFQKWPSANDNIRSTQGDFGSIKIHKIESKKFVVNMFSQFNGGGIIEMFGKDSAHNRMIKFAACLLQMKRTLDDKRRRFILKDLPLTVSFPYLIGCGIAGGDWEVYSSLLEGFSNAIEKQGGQVTLYKFTPK